MIYVAYKLYIKFVIACDTCVRATLNDVTASTLYNAILVTSWVHLTAFPVALSYTLLVRVCTVFSEVTLWSMGRWTDKIERTNVYRLYTGHRPQLMSAPHLSACCVDDKWVFSASFAGWRTARLIRNRKMTARSSVIDSISDTVRSTSLSTRLSRIRSL